ncbi:MAG: hypothetical protein HYX39_07420 [Bacteroidetes bacterium]|nr:hypothetical protein [Bacteroidota bacterium]
MKRIIFSLFILISLAVTSQTNEIKLNAEKIKKFEPYIHFKHTGYSSFNEWRENNKLLYTKEMWYYSESFYVKRNHLTEGVTLNEEIIDITRFESQRKANEEVTVILPGFKDALVLLPGNKLIYKP